MDGRRVRGVRSSATGSKRKKAPAGLRIVERDGHWHVTGTIRLGGRSIRIRRSTELPATAGNEEAADQLRIQIENDVRNEVLYGIRPTVALAIAARDYLQRPRERPLGATAVSVIQEVTREFGTRLLRDIADRDWQRFVQRRHATNASATRERYLNSLLAFLNWCAAPAQGYIDRSPAFDRDGTARNPNTRARRRVQDLRPELVLFMLEHAAPHLRAQIAVEWSAGARVSSVLTGVRLCDVVLAEGREQITFHNTKNGRPVTAALHPWAAEELRAYLRLRGKLHDREGMLFLTPKGEPYSTKSGHTGVKNKTAFNAMKRRAAAAILNAADKEAAALLEEGQAKGAAAVRAEAQTEAELVGQVTQHWFRHMLADTMLKMGVDLRTVMEQGGWKDPRSVMGYTRDVEEYRRSTVASLPIGGTSLTRKRDNGPKTA